MNNVYLIYFEIKQTISKAITLSWGTSKRHKSKKRHHHHHPAFLLPTALCRPWKFLWTWTRCRRQSFVTSHWQNHLRTMKALFCRYSSRTPSGCQNTLVRQFAVEKLLFSADVRFQQPSRKSTVARNSWLLAPLR